MIDVDSGSFFAIIFVAALAAVTVVALPARFAPPVVVVELLLGIVIGPQVLGLAESDDFIDFFSNLGLGMLFFFAGYEIDFERIKGRPLKLALWGWLLSLAARLRDRGPARGRRNRGLAPVHRLGAGDDGDRDADPDPPRQRRAEDAIRDPAAGGGGIGEFGPILLITLVLSTAQPLHEAAILAGFVALALAIALLSVRLGSRGLEALERTRRGQQPARGADRHRARLRPRAARRELGLDVLLGGFVAGMIVRAALRGREIHAFESKLTAVGFGFLIPFFFVDSGINFDLEALGSAAALAKLALFLALFLVVRGVPALLLYRDALERRDRVALAFYCATELPLVVAITTLATAAGEMRSSTAAGLVGAAMLSTLIYPFVARTLRARAGPSPPEPVAAAPA